MKMLLVFVGLKKNFGVQNLIIGKELPGNIYITLRMKYETLRTALLTSVRHNLSHKILCICSLFLQSYLTLSCNRYESQGGFKNNQTCLASYMNEYLEILLPCTRHHNQVS